MLGLYLGDGCVSEYPRTHKLRITLDERYPGIVTSALDAVRRLTGTGGTTKRPDHCVEVYSYSRRWPCLLPQHGPGLKHLRPIVLAGWQREHGERCPEQLLRGLIESDGWRFVNTGRNDWSAPRYGFGNRSQDIHRIFRGACERLGLHWTASGAHVTYVSRIADVATLDAFIGPKR